jgi:prephenate dehydrogenase
VERITIVGLGPLGTSIGLGLKKANLSNAEIIGTSRERRNASNANKVGAVDRTYAGLGAAVDGANLVVLDADMGETEELLKTLGQRLEPGAVITDLGVMKSKAVAWAEQYMKEGVYFVPGRPLPKKPITTLEEADGAAFQGCRYCIVPPVSAPEAAVKTVVGMADALGSTPFFMDALEHDSFAAGTSYLPVVLSSALVTATTSSESWREMHRLASSEWDAVGCLASNSPDDNLAIARANPELLAQWLDKLILELQAYREKILEDSEDLRHVFVEAWEARARWEHGVVEDRSGPEIPTAMQTMGAFLFGDRLMRRQREMSEREKAHQWTYDRGRR